MSKKQEKHRYTFYEQILFEVPQECELDFISFDIFLSDLFPVPDGIYFSSFPDANTAYKACNNIESLQQWKDER